MHIYSFYYIKDKIHICRLFYHNSIKIWINFLSFRIEECSPLGSMCRIQPYSYMWLWFKMKNHCKRSITTLKRRLFVRQDFCCVIVRVVDVFRMLAWGVVLPIILQDVLGRAINHVEWMQVFIFYVISH